MSFSQYLRQLGQPIAYYPQLAKPLGGVTAAVLFGQLFYWQDKTDKPLTTTLTTDSSKKPKTATELSALMMMKPKPSQERSILRGKMSLSTH